MSALPPVVAGVLAARLHMKIDYVSRTYDLSTYRSFIRGVPQRKQVERTNESPRGELT